MINPIKTNSTKISIPTRNQPCIRITIKKTLITRIRMINITIKINRTNNHHHRPTTIKNNNIMVINMRKVVTHCTNLKAINNHLIKTTLIKTMVNTTMSKEVSTTTTKTTITIRIRTRNRMEDRSNPRIRGDRE